MKRSGSNQLEDLLAPRSQEQALSVTRPQAQALAILNERIASPNEIAQELGQSVGHVSYHVNVLKKCECIELVDTASRRGAVEHFYRATIRLLIDDETWARLPASIRPSLTATLLQDLVKDAGGALSAGTFDARPDSHLTWTPMILDEEGWQEASGSLRELLERILEIQALSAERLTKAGEAGFRVSVAAMAYETPTSGDHRPNPLPDPS